MDCNTLSERELKAELNGVSYVKIFQGIIKLQLFSDFDSAASRDNINIGKKFITLVNFRKKK